MEANRSRMRWTYAEFARLPTSGSTRFEVIDGELAVTPAPTPGHQIVVGNLVRLLGAFIHEHALGKLFAGPIDVLLGEGDYLEPDLAFVRADRAHLVSDRGVEGPPDLVVEILSPSIAHRDPGIKLARYRHFGVAEYSVERWRLAEAADAPEILAPDASLRWTPFAGGPSLELAVCEIFAGAR